ncbi:MAG: DUF2220 domain-containing protein, partial [Fibrobacteria bacterium]|nr:DUF2220 domain-containing protein [Fibrobacteria bacterium]
RLRFLDQNFMLLSGQVFSDISAPVDELSSAEFKPAKVIITENEMTFLTLPVVKKALGIFGRGFSVSLLQKISWLKDCRIYYWGDLDAQGFQILSSLRSHYPDVQSLMMDQETFMAFKKFTVTGKDCAVCTLPNLTEEESEMFRYLAVHQLRLEQERISHGYMLEKMAEISQLR